MPPAPPDPLVRLLTDRLLDAQDVLARRHGWVRGVLASALPSDTIREVAAALVPVIRQAAEEAMQDAFCAAVASSSDPDYDHGAAKAVADALAAYDLPPGAGERPGGHPAGAAVSGASGPGPSTHPTTREP